jgi:outer membrane protein TolC
MMKNILLTTAIILTFSMNAFALTMQQAVSSALDNSFLLKQYKSTTKQSMYNAKASKSAYMPSLSASYSYADSNRKTAYPYGDKSSQASISLSYNLFNGLSDLYTIKSASAKAKADKYMENATKADIVRDVQKAYLDVLKSIKEIEVAKEAVELLEKQYKDAKVAFKVGTQAKNEMLKVEVETASIKQEQLQAQSALVIAVQNLSYLMGVELATTENFVDVEEQIETTQPDRKQLLVATVKNRSEIKYIHQLIKSAMYDKKSIRGGYMPKIDISATYNSYGDDTNPSNRNYTYDTENVIGATATWSIFDGFSKSNRIKAAAENKNALINKLRDTEKSLTLQMDNAIENLKLAKASLGVAKKSVISAEENYRITHSQYKQSVATNTDLLDARYMLTRAKSDYNTALYNLYKAIADIDRVTEKNPL